MLLLSEKVQPTPIGTTFFEKSKKRYNFFYLQVIEKLISLYVSILYSGSYKIRIFKIRRH